MKASDWLTQERSKARHEGRMLGLVYGLVIGIGIFAGVTVALLAYSDRKHEEAVSSIRQADRLLLTKCQTDLSEFSAIAELARSYDDRVVAR